MTKIILFVAVLASSGKWQVIAPAVFDNTSLCAAASDFWRAAIREVEDVPNENIVTICHRVRVKVGQPT